MDVCVLLYGDYPNLAARCLESLVAATDSGDVTRLRLGLNQVSPTSESVIRQIASRFPAAVTLYRERNNRNVYKYPLMRRMLYDDERPVTSQFVVWFDDDSFLKPHLKNQTLWSAIRRFKPTGDAMYGRIYRYRPFDKQQVRAIQAQPWYSGKPVGPPQCPSFCTGGFWIAPFAFLHSWDYPFLDLKHSGGDTMLGELCRQQGVALRDVWGFSKTPAVNASDSGVESAQPTRGERTIRLWEDWDTISDLPDSQRYAHHEFDLIVEDIGQHRIRVDAPHYDRPARKWRKVD